MLRARQEALETIGKQPDDVEMDEIMYGLYVADKIRRGREEFSAGRTVSHEGLPGEIVRW